MPVLLGLAAESADAYPYLGGEGLGEGNVNKGVRPRRGVVHVQGSAGRVRTA